MLVIYDENGKITQCIIQAQVSLETLAERYTEAGIPNIMFEGDDANGISTLYVKNGAVITKPRVAFSGENRLIKADSNDALTFVFDPSVATISVLFDGKLVNREQVTDGILEFTTDHAGTYTIVVEPAFPYQTEIITIEATA